MNSMQLLRCGVVFGALLAVPMSCYANIIIYSNDFNMGSGGYTHVGVAKPDQWTYSPTAGKGGGGGWYMNYPGDGVNAQLLMSPSNITVVGAGPVVLEFDHRYSQEQDLWDGGVVEYCVNTGTYVYVYVPSGSFTAGGYDGACVGNGPGGYSLWSSNIWGNTSSGYGSGNFIHSVATLGTFAKGDKIGIRFHETSDEAAGTGNNPIWEIDNVALKGEPPPEPVILNLSATNVTASTACLNGNMTSAGSFPATPTVFWDTTDKSATFTWAYTNQWGSPQSAGALSYVASVTPNLEYYYTYYATNAGGDAWAAPSQYFISGAITLSSPDTTCGINQTDTATIVVTRPDTCISKDLVIFYNITGNVTNGTDVIATPGSGALTIPAGQTTASITVTPKAPWNRGEARTFDVSLASGPYAIGSPNTISCTLAAYTNPVLSMTGDWHIDTLDGNKLKRRSDNALVLLPETGLTLDGVPYAYQFRAASLNMNGYSIYGARDLTTANAPNGAWIIDGDITGNGNFYYYRPNSYGPPGNLRLEAGGSISVSNLWTFVNHLSYCPWCGPDTVDSGMYIWAKNGKLTINGTVWVNPGNSESNHGYPTTLRSEGAATNRGISILGTLNYEHLYVWEEGGPTNQVTGKFSILHHSNTNEGDGSPDKLKLSTQGDITLAGGIMWGNDGSREIDGGKVEISGSTDLVLRAGNVIIGGDVNTYGTGSAPPGFQGAGNNYVSILASNVQIAGRIDTRVNKYGGTRSGNVTIDALENVFVGGYIDTYTPYPTESAKVSSPGRVWIAGKRILICGTNANGESIRTMPLLPVSGWGTFTSTQPGDGNVTLTCLDTSTKWFNPRSPFTCDTSAILVAGRIATAYGSAPNVIGSVSLSGVGVYLGGDITNANPNAAVTNNIHCGVPTYGVHTHLVENNVQWPGGMNVHAINYPASPAVNQYFTDVPYAGNLGNQGSLLLLY